MRLAGGPTERVAPFSSMEAIVSILFALLVGLLSVRRLTEKPVQIRATVTESAANTYTEATINLPVAPVIQSRRDGDSIVQGIELMKVVSQAEHPDLEDDQNNTVHYTLHKDSQTSALNLRNTNVIWGRRIRTSDEFTTSGATSQTLELYKYDDLTDGDGNGFLLLERSIFLGAAGTGNAAAKSVDVMLICHLVEVDAADAVVQLSLDD